MYSTFELDELFQILNSIKGFKLDNHNGATQHYEYEYGGVGYDDIPAANPETTAITTVTRKDATIPTNYPIGTREHNKTGSKSYLE